MGKNSARNSPLTGATATPGEAILCNIWREILMERVDALSAATDIAEWIMSGESWIVWKVVSGAFVSMLGLTALGSFGRLIGLYAK